MDDWSIAGWVFMTAGAAAASVLAQWASGQAGRLDLVLTIGAAASLNIGGASVANTGATLVSSATWEHWAVTRAGGAISIYKNSAAVGSGSSATAITNTPWRIGSYTSGRYLAGSIGDPLYYSRALSPAEIKQLADPSNVMLSGLILPPRRRVFASAGAAPVAVVVPSFGGHFSRRATGVPSFGGHFARRA